MHHGCLIFCLSRFERVITFQVCTESLLFGRFPSRSEKRHGHVSLSEAREKIRREARSPSVCCLPLRPLLLLLKLPSLQCCDCHGFHVMQ